MLLKALEKVDFSKTLNDLFKTSGVDFNKSSVSKVAKEIGISDETLRQQLNPTNTKKPSFDILQKLFDYFSAKIKDFDMGQFFGTTTDNVPKPIVEKICGLRDDDLKESVIIEQVEKFFRGMKETYYEDAIDDYFHEGNNIIDLDKLYRIFRRITEKEYGNILCQVCSFIEGIKGGGLSIGELILIRKMTVKNLNKKVNDRLDKILDAHSAGSLKINPKNIGTSNKHIERLKSVSQYDDESYDL